MILRLFLLFWFFVSPAHAQTFVYDGVVQSQTVGCAAHGGSGCGYSDCSGSCPATSYGCPATTATGVSGWGWKYDGVTQWCWHISSTCPPGQQFVNGVCQTPPNNCTVGDTQVQGQQYDVPYNGGAPSTVCLGGCTFAVGDSVCLPALNTCGIWLGKGTGEQCTATSPTAADPQSTEADCLAKHQGYVTVNGVTTCAMASPTNPVQTTSTSSSTTTGATSGTTSTTTQTTDYGSYTQTNTTSTTTNGAGTSTTSSSSTDPKQPTSSVGGADDCNIAPACSGDAIQCAIMYKQWQQWCQVQSLNTSNDFSQAYMSASADVGMPNPIATSKSMSDIFTLGNHVSVAASCPSSISIPIPGGQTYNLDLSYVCQYLALISLIVKTLAWLFVGRLTLEAL